jgi:hypothetical protein
VCRPDLHLGFHANFHFREINEVANRYTSCVLLATTIRVREEGTRHDSNLRSAAARIADAHLVRYLATIERKKAAARAEGSHDVGARAEAETNDDAQRIDAAGLSNRYSGKHWFRASSTQCNVQPQTRPLRLVDSSSRAALETTKDLEASMKSILDRSFRYTKSIDTDLRKTFARVRREQRQQGRAQCESDTPGKVFPIRQHKHAAVS